MECVWLSVAQDTEAYAAGIWGTAGYAQFRIMECRHTLHPCGSRLPQCALRPQPLLQRARLRHLQEPRWPPMRPAAAGPLASGWLAPPLARRARPRSRMGPPPRTLSGYARCTNSRRAARAQRKSNRARSEALGRPARRLQGRRLASLP